MTAPPLPDREDLADQLARSARDFDLAAPDDPFEDAVEMAALRRRRRRVTDDPVGALTLVERDGVLRWEAGAASSGASTSSARRARPQAARRAGAPRRGLLGPGGDGEVVTTLRFRKLAPNQVHDQLRKLDAKLTPRRGLLKLMLHRDGAEWVAARPQDVPDAGKVLLFIHGTFSESEAYTKQLGGSDAGRAFLDAARRQYAAVLAFDHPTVSVSPLLNAFDLQQHFAGKQCDVDVIAHSRGGLVARWWLEGFGPERGGRSRAVLVGSPLGGTGLAAPERLRSAMSHLTNIGTVLRAALPAAAVNPFLVAPMVLLQVVTSVTSVAARTPLFDAAIAMIPGLACQSRVADNAELVRLRRPLGAGSPQYFAVRSNFETDDPGWRFWRHFRKGNLADAGADAVFDGHNDLVVDTAAMTEFGPDGIPFDDVRTLDFGTSGAVHHVNYFQQPRTVQFLRQSLQIS